MRFPQGRGGLRHSSVTDLFVTPIPWPKDDSGFAFAALGYLTLARALDSPASLLWATKKPRLLTGPLGQLQSSIQSVMSAARPCRVKSVSRTALAFPVEYGCELTRRYSSEDGSGRR
jgi:hypothetical protein